jgi:tetratricopeptide (TPR) repeat protein
MKARRREQPKTPGGAGRAGTPAAAPGALPHRAPAAALRRPSAWFGPLAVAAGVAVAVWYFGFRDTRSERVTRIVGEAREALALFEYARAEDLLRRALAEFPDSAVLHHNLGALYVRQDRYEAAREEFVRSAELCGPEANEVRAEEYFQAAQIDLRLRRYPDAERALQKAIAAHPARALLHTQLVDVQLSFLRNPARADSSTQRFLRLCGRTPDNLRDAARVHYRRGSYAVSTALALAAAQAADTMMAAHVLVAKSYWKSGRSEEGLRYLEGPLARYPEAAELWSVRGNLEIGRGRYDDALRSLDRALELDPRHYETQRTKMIALFNADRFEEALAQAELCKELTRSEGERNFLDQEMERIRRRLRGEKEERVRIEPPPPAEESPRGRP